ncbi:MAG: RING finger protein [Candidatus Hodarchaeales archaeon]
MVPVQLILVVIIVVIIILFAKRMRSSRLLNEAQRLEQEGKYLEAVDLYSRINLNVAVRMTIEAPRATQILVLRRLQSMFTKSSINSALERFAAKYAREQDYVRAATAFLLAGKSFDAAKTYVDAGISYLPAAIRITDQDPKLSRRKEEFVSSLATYAFNNDRFTEAAELLRLAGANEEAQAVLVAAVSRLRQRGRSEEANLLAATSEKTSAAVKTYLRMTRENINVGNFPEAKRWLSSAQQVLAGKKAEVEQLPSELRNELQNHSQLLRMLDNARDFLRKDAHGKAQALYDELLELFGETLPGTIFAEAALANEASDAAEAARLYQIAAQKAPSREAKGKMLTKAKDLEVQARTGRPTARTMVAEAPPDEYCSVCHMAIETTDEYARCTQCGSPAHFGHLAEWLKIRGTCPICRTKIHLQEKEIAAES